MFYCGAYLNLAACVFFSWES